MPAKKTGKQTQRNGSTSSSYAKYFSLFICVPVLIAFILNHQTIDEKISYLLGSVLFGVKFVIVLDCGSTGSRVLGYKFHFNSLVNPRVFVLQDEFWAQSKPGLASYADSPKQAAQSISKLLSQIENFVPSGLKAKTPVVLRATAGLRLLPQEKSDALLKVVSDVLVNSGYKIPTDLDVVDIMNPMKEGLYGWFTVNYLLNEKMDSSILNDTYVALDLGGGSTQIVFYPSVLPINDLNGKDHYLHRASFLNESLRVYSHSYLGMGLMSARKSVVEKETDDRSSSSHNSSCYTSSQSEYEWSFNGNNFKIQKSKLSNFHSCHKLVKDVIHESNIHQPSEMKHRNIAAFSYFYDLALDSNIIDGSSKGLSSIKISHFKDAAVRVCDKEKLPNLTCLDLTYMYTLLTDGYGLDGDMKINVCKKINGHEVSWALGLAYTLL